MIHIALPTAPARTDFSTWERRNLERFAREAADENKQLREDVKTALEAYRALVRVGVKGET